MSVCVGNLRVMEIVMWLAAVGGDIREHPALLSALLSERRGLFSDTEASWASSVAS